MLVASIQLGVLRWLLRELSTDQEDMIAFVQSLPETDDEDAQALLEELNSPRPAARVGPILADYQRDRQLLGPSDALRLLRIPRATFYALVKRGTFPTAMLVDEIWIGWPRDVLLEWADASERKRVANLSSIGYAPFERYHSPRSNRRRP